MTKYIGVIGTGQLSARMIRATFNDQQSALGDIKLILPVSKAHFTEEVEIVADWAVANKVPFEVVHDGGKLSKAADEFVDEAVRVTKVDSVPVGLVNLLEKATGSGSKLFVFWDEDDVEGYTAFEKAWDAEIGSFDLCNGLEELTFDDDEAEDAPADEEPEAEPEEPKHEVDEWAELGRKTAKELKELCAEKGITVNRSGKGRIAKGAYLSALKAFQETGATEYYQEEDLVKGVEPKAEEPTPEPEEDEDEEPEVPDDGQIPEADEDDAPELPTDDEDVDVIEQEPGDFAVEGEYGVTETSNTSVGVQNIAYTGTVPVVAWRPAQATLVSTCLGCGGPIHALASDQDGGFPSVRWDHAKGCPLA